MQHLGRADAVDDIDAEMALEALAEFGRESLASGGDEAQSHLLARRQAGGGKHAGKARRGAVEHGRPDAADLAAPALEHRVRRGAALHQQGGGADAHRERQRIAEAIGEEQLGGGEADIVLAQGQHGFAVKLQSPVGVAVRMHRAFGPAGRARGIKPESGIVGAGRGGLLHRPGGGEKGLEFGLAEFERAGRARDHDLVDLVVGLDERALESGLQRAADQHGLGAGVFKHIGVVVGGEQRVDRDRDRAGIERAEEGHGPIDGVEHEDQHALLALDPGRAQGAGEAADALGKVAVGEAALVVEEGGFGGAAGIGGEEMGGDVEVFGRRLGQALGRGHGLLPAFVAYAL